MNMIRYRIYTEDMGDVKGILSGALQSATILKARGMWQGVWENAIVIEYIGYDTELGLIMRIARQIKLENNQETVIFTHEEIQMEVV